MEIGGLAYWLVIMAVLVGIFASDWRYQTIPDELVWVGVIVALVWQAWIHFQSSLGLALEVYFFAFWNLAWPALAGAGFFWGLVWLTKGKGMGWGDVKLAGLMGLVLGWPGIALAFYLAFLTGAIIGVILILVKKKRFGEPVAFGPFLVGATWLVILIGDQLIDRLLTSLGFGF
jgi:leader peptidase (prepilin peptidase)/N-methyltransferase